MRSQIPLAIAKSSLEETCLNHSGREEKKSQRTCLRHCHLIQPWKLSFLQGIRSLPNNFKIEADYGAAECLPNNFNVKEETMRIDGDMGYKRKGGLGNKKMK